MKRTGWYSGNQKPIRLGVYERYYQFGARGEIYFCYFDGFVWLVGAKLAMDAMNAAMNSYPHDECAMQILPWRGLRKDFKFAY